MDKAWLDAFVRQSTRLLSAIIQHKHANPTWTPYNPVFFLIDTWCYAALLEGRTKLEYMLDELEIHEKEGTDGDCHKEYIDETVAYLKGCLRQGKPIEKPAIVHNTLEPSDTLEEAACGFNEMIHVLMNEVSCRRRMGKLPVPVPENLHEVFYNFSEILSCSYRGFPFQEFVRDCIATVEAAEREDPPNPERAELLLSLRMRLAQIA